MDADGWTVRPSDVAVLKLPFPPAGEVLRALGSWRDWLAGYGASPAGTTGSAAWSLLRATLERTLFTSQPKRSLPPIPWTIGGRQELGPAGVGRFDGELEQRDLPAAYAAEVGNLRYGGSWLTGDELPKRQLDPEWWGREGRPVFVRARVRIPAQRYGPLPRRPRRRVGGIAAAFLGAEYPAGTRMQGVWCWPELEAAIDAGDVKVERIVQVWAHLAADQPFLPWWGAVQDGRGMPGFAGLLAKTTGNALWGRFCMESGSGVRTIRGRARGRLVAREVAQRGGLPAAHDLAETVSGRIRGRLYSQLVAAGGGLVSAHTDGVWLRDGAEVLAGWRRKGTARRLDLLGPQTLRYWPARAHEREPFHVFAGMPSELAPPVFEQLWRDAGFPAEFPIDTEVTR
jgi:hypothetical protein